MSNTDIYGLMSVKGGQKQKIMNFSNAREKTYAQYQQLTDAQKKGVIIVDDYPIPEESDSVSVTADGVKTFGQLFNELYALVDTNKVTPTSVLTFNDTVWQRLEVTSNILEFSYCAIANNLPFISYVVIKPSSSSYTRFINNAVADSTSSVPASGTTITLIYDYYKNLDIHTEYLAKNCMLTGGGNVEDELDDKVDKFGDTMGGNLSIDKGSSTTAEETSWLLLGNNKAKGTVGNSTGVLCIYGSSDKSALILDDNPNGFTANRRINIPDKSGTLALKTIKNVKFTHVNYGMWRADTNECIVAANSGNYHIIGGQGEYYRILKYNSGSPVPEDTSNSPITIECTLI